MTASHLNQWDYSPVSTSKCDQRVSDSTPSHGMQTDSMCKRQLHQQLRSQLKRDEETLRSKQVLLESFICKKNDIEKRLQETINILHSVGDISVLKSRIRAAREQKRKVANELRDAEEYIALLTETNHMHLVEATRRKREYLQLKQSIDNLTEDVEHLREKAATMVTNVKRNSCIAPFPERVAAVQNVSKPLRGDISHIVRLREEKRACQEQLRRAKEMYTLAEKREAKMTRLLTTLEAREASLQHRLRFQQESSEKIASPMSSFSAASLPDCTGNLLTLSVSAGAELSMTPCADFLLNAGAEQSCPGMLSICTGGSQTITQGKRQRQHRMVSFLSLSKDDESYNSTLKKNSHGAKSEPCKSVLQKEKN